MAKYKAELPNDLIKQLESLNANVDTMLKDMTRESAKKVYENIKISAPKTWFDSDIMTCLKITKTYKTPTDDGINTQVGFYGYFKDHNDRKTPAPLVVNVTEYGRSSAPYPKHPFFRKSFKKSEIEKIMKSIEEKYLPKE